MKSVNSFLRFSASSSPKIILLEIDIFLNKIVYLISCLISIDLTSEYKLALSDISPEIVNLIFIQNIATIISVLIKSLNLLN